MADPPADPPAEPLAAAALPLVATPAFCMLGTLPEFDPTTNGISSYLERVQLYFEANAVEEGGRVAVLLTAIGAKTYETLWSLLAPACPCDKTLS